ncbi:MAG: hypothetical protein QXE79_05525 [Candidatus Bathyarchaeia archaeon]
MLLACACTVKVDGFRGNAKKVEEDGKKPDGLRDLLEGVFQTTE